MVSSNFTYDSDFSKVTRDIQELVRIATHANSTFAQLNKTAASVKMEAARSFSAQAGFAGFKSQIVDLTGATENFGQQLMKNKLTMKEYFSEAAKAYKKDSKARALAEREVRRAASAVVGIGDINGRRKGMLITPDSLDMSNSNVQLKIATKQYEIFNDLVQKGSTALVNWGKNTQWAGRQLTVGLTVPMGIFASQSLKAFADVDKEITRFKKVYGSDLTGAVGDATDEMLSQIKTMGSEFAKQYGIASKETIALAADLAAAGFEGQKLATAVNQTTRMMVLGEVDRQEAMKATLSIQTAFNQSSKELAQSVDFLNAVENSTSASLQDLTEAIPKTGPVIQALGGDIKDLSVLMTALREGGISAGEGANAIKSGMASLISPTKSAIELSRQFGIDLEGIVKRNKGKLMPLLVDFQDQLRGLDDFGKAKVIESIFGKYQFARISALFDNLNQQGSQTVGMIKLMSMSADELAKKSYSELQAQQNAPSTRLAAMQQQLQENLIKVGADLAETLLPVMQGALDILQKIVDGFNNLPEPIKNFVKIIGSVVAASGPILMLAGIFGNLIGNAVKFGMSIVNLFKRLTGNPVKQLQILSDEELAAKLAADQLTGAYDRQKTSIMELNLALDTYIANLKLAQTISPPGVVNPRRGPGPARFQTGGIIYAKNGVSPGGRINGYGGGDTVPALLEPGEFVINKQSSQKYKGLLTDINQGKRVYGYSNAGQVTPNGAEQGTASDDRSFYGIETKPVSLKTATTMTEKDIEKALALLSPEKQEAFRKILVTEQDMANIIEKFQRLGVPGFEGISSENFRYGAGTDRAHYAAMQNVLNFVDTLDGVEKYGLINDYVLTTTSDNTGVNRLVQKIVDSGEDVRLLLERELGYGPGQVLRIAQDTRPLIVNPELRDFLSRIRDVFYSENPEFLSKKIALADIFFKNSEGKYSENNSAKLLGSIAALEGVNPFIDDKIVVREILEAQLQHSLAQTVSEKEWNLLKGNKAFQPIIDSLVDDLAKGRPLNEQEIEKIKKASSALTGRRLLNTKEQLIVKEFANLEGDIKKLTPEEKNLLASIPQSEKDALIDELGIRNKTKVTKKSLSSGVPVLKDGKTKMTSISSSRTSLVAEESGMTLPFSKKASTILPEHALASRTTRFIRRKDGGIVLSPGTSIQNGILHAAGGFTGFKGWGQGRPGQYAGPSWDNPMNRIKNDGKTFRFDGEKIGEAAGKSTKGELSGFYKKNGKQYYVKTFGDNVSAVAEVAANRILSKMFPGIDVPKSFLSKIGSTSEIGAISEIIKTRSIDELVAARGKLNEESALEAMIAQSVAGGRDLSPGNFLAHQFDGRVVHVDPSEAFVKKLASGKPVTSAAELPSGVDRALANFGVIKGGAKRYARDIVSGFGMAPGRAEVIMSRSLSRAASIPRETLLSEVSQVTKGLPKKARREIDAWAKQLGHNSFEEAIVDIAMKRVQEVASVVPQLAKSIGGKTTMSTVSGLSIRTKAQHKAFRKGLERLVTGSTTMDRMAIDAMTPLRDPNIPYIGLKNLPIQWSRKELPELLKTQRQSLHDKISFRGMGVTEQELVQILSGNPFSLSRSSFASTSASEATAAGFAARSDGNKKIVLRIKSKAGTWEMPLSELGAQGMYVKGQGAFNELENGILNGRARTVGYEEKDGIIYADTELIDSRALQYFAMGGPAVSAKRIIDKNAKRKSIDKILKRKRASVFDIDKTIIQTVSGGSKPGSYVGATLESGKPMANQLAAIMEAQARGEELIFLTARPTMFSAETIATLEKLGIKDFKLRMLDKSAGDPNKAHEYKVKAIRELQKDYDISSIWDDEFANITALRKEGLNVKIPVITNGHNPLTANFGKGGVIGGPQKLANPKKPDYSKIKKVEKPKISYGSKEYYDLPYKEREAAYEEYKKYQDYLAEKENARYIAEYGMTRNEYNVALFRAREMSKEQRQAAAASATGDDLLNRYLGKDKSIRRSGGTFGGKQMDELNDIDSTNTVFNLLLRRAQGVNAQDAKRIKRLQEEAAKYKSIEDMPPGLRALISDQFAIHRGSIDRLKPFSTNVTERDYPGGGGPLEGPGYYTAPTLVESDIVWRFFAGDKLNRIRYDDAAFERILAGRGYITGMKTLAEEYAAYLGSKGSSKDISVEGLFKSNRKFKGYTPDMSIGEWFAGMSPTDPFFKWLKNRGYIGVNTTNAPAGGTHVNWMAGEPGVSNETFTPNEKNIVGYATGGKLPGFGGGDKVPAMLEPGEFVINKNATKANLGLLESINNGGILKRKTGGIIPGYATGGLVAEAGMMGMNLMFLPMMYEQAKASEGTMQKMLYALVAIQGIVGAIQAAQLIGGIGRSIGGKVAGARAQGALLTSGAVKSGAMNALKGQGTMAAFTAARSAGMGVFSSITAAAGVALGPILAVGAAVAAIGVGIYLWRKRIDDLANTSRSYYKEATEMAKVYNIELNKSRNALAENRKYAEAFGTASAVVAKGQTDKDYAAAIKKDYEEAINGIKDLNSEQDKSNRLASIYASLVTQGFSLTQAKEITAEIARQAEATSAFNSVYPKLQSAIKDTETAMQVLDTTFAYHMSQLGTAEEKVAALTEAYTRLQAASNINPTQSVVSTQNLIATSVKNDGAGAVGDLVNAQLANAGINQQGVDAILQNLAGTTNVDWASQTGQDLATTILAGLNAGMTEKDFTNAMSLEDVKIKVGVQVSMQDAKLALNKELELVIKELQDGITKVNKLYDDKIAAVEAEKKAIEDAHDKKMKALEEEGNALRDRGDLIRDNTDFYIKQLEKEYNTEQYYQQQRKNAASGLESLSKGDIFGYLQSQMQTASDAAQFGREQAIQQIQDTRDAALAALDAQIKANDAAKGALDDATQKQLDGKDNQIQALNIARSKIIKDLNSRIKEAQAIMNSPEIATKKIDEFQTKLGKTVEGLPTKLQKPFETVGENLAGTISTTLNKKASEINSVFVQNGDKLKSAIKMALGTATQIYDPSTGKAATSIILPGGYEIKITKETPSDAGVGFDDTGNTLPKTPPKVVDKKKYKVGKSYRFGQTTYTLQKLPNDGYQWQNSASIYDTKPITQYKNRGGKIMKYGAGGMTIGFGNSDTVPAMLTPGEFVADRTATRRNLPVLQAMNAGATFTIPQLRGYNDTIESENETHNNNINMPINININGSNMTVDQIKNEIYTEIVRAKTMVVNSIVGIS